MLSQKKQDTGLKGYNMTNEEILENYIVYLKDRLEDRHDDYEYKTIEQLNEEK